MNEIRRIGMDTSKHIFQLHGVNAAETPVLRRKLRRRDMIAFPLAGGVRTISASAAGRQLFGDVP